MSKPFLLLALGFLLLTLTSATCWLTASVIPSSEETAIREDFVEWVRPPRLVGSCEELPVVKVEWITPRGVAGKRPVVWLKHGDTFGVILGLSNAQAEWISGIVSAQPVMRLHDVLIYRLCRFSKVTPW